MKGKTIMRDMRKLIAAAAAAAIMSSSVSVVFAAQTNFTDMSDSSYSWAATAVKEMASAGYINGYEDGTYRPDNQVTRQECLSLFARVMGSNNDSNKEVLALAHEKYDEMLAPYSLTWGSDEIAYLVYNGVLKETDLVTYLKNDEKSKPMSRYEAAIIITKAMGGEKQAVLDKNAQLSYTDAVLIPASAVGYVKYASDQGILKGMEDGSFSPTSPVTRAQIAVMLSRVVEKCDYSFKEGKLTKIDISAGNVTYKDADGKVTEYAFSKDTVMRAEGESYEAEDMIQGVSAVFAFSGSKLMSIDALASTPDQTIVGKYEGKANSSGKLFLRFTPNGESSSVSYECAADVAMTFDDSPATINSFTQGDSIEVDISNGKIEAIRGTKKETTLSGATVQSVSINPELTVTISHADEEYDGTTYRVDDNVVVKKNGLTSSMDQIYAGDRVTLTLQYGVIKKIVATSTTVTKEGTISEIVFSDAPKITVVTDGQKNVYDVTKDCEITVNGEESDLYSFRVGDKVTLTIESGAVKKIKATSTTSSAGSVSGVVASINSSYGFINVDTGNGNIQTVFCSDNSTKFLTIDGVMKKMSNVKTGDSVQVNGTVSNGAFVAKVVLITSEAKTSTSN